MPRSPLTVLPRDLLCLDDYERLAPDFMSAATHAWIAGGSGGERCLGESPRAFSAVRIYNRLMADVSGGHTRVDLLGTTLLHPVLLAPVAFQRLVHPEGELATARAAAATDTCMVLSTSSSCSLEDVASASTAPRWFQLYFQHAQEITADLVSRAERSGYTAIVVTLDAAVKSASRRALRAGFVMPAQVQAASLEHYPGPARRELASEASIVFQGMMADAPSWADMQWLLASTRLPVLVKGVSHPDDAARLLEMGVAGFVVSGHGGRALDELPAPLHLLPAIRAIAGKDIPVLLDGGVRSGADVFKAIAMGASAVMVGRPQMYALAVAGALGVAHMIKTLRDELEVCMAQAGCPTLASIDRRALWFPGTRTVETCSC